MARISGVDIPREKKVEVAAMYRPRFLGAPSVPEQVTADGRPASAHGHYPCFSSPAARQWAAHWGTMILQQCAGLEEIRWNGTPVCPHCQSQEAYKLTPKGDTKTSARKGVYKCKACRKQFTVTVGTIFEGSRIKIADWLMAIYLMCSSKKGISQTPPNFLTRSRSQNRGTHAPLPSSDSHF